MIRATDIHSLTEFTRNARAYIQQIKRSKTPMAITVNGDAQVVVLDAEAYQKMVDELEQAKQNTPVVRVPSLERQSSPDASAPFSMVRGASSRD